MKAASSLRRRLLLAGAGGVTLAALLAAWTLGIAFERAVMRNFDHRLGEDLDRLISGVEVLPDARVVLNREPPDQRYDAVFSGWYWAMLGEDGSLRMSRSAWDAERFGPLLQAATATRRAVLAEGPRGQQLRVLTQRVRFGVAGRAPAFAVAGDLQGVRDEVATFRWLAATAVAAIALALLGVMLWQVRYGLRPLRDVAATLGRMRSGEEVRFEAGVLPGEVAPLAIQVNELLDEHVRRVARARHAAQDLAHALKTPLAALTLDAQDAAMLPAARVREHVDRMQAAVERHLAVHPGNDTRQRTPVATVVEALHALLQRVHAARDIGMEVDGAITAIFAGSREDLEEMLGNLLDNAFKWARSRIVLQVRGQADRMVIAIDDDGAGLASTQHDAALQRGVRLDARAPGSGFGLAIVQQVAAGYGGALRLSHSAHGGLRVELELPAAARDAGPRSLPTS